MQTIGNRVLVTKFEEPKKEGFETVDTQDNFIYKGVVKQIGVLPQLRPEMFPVPEYSPSTMLERIEPNIKEGDVILFAKYSPDTHEIEIDGVKCKFVALSDILAVI